MLGGLPALALPVVAGARLSKKAQLALATTALIATVNED